MSWEKCQDCDILFPDSWDVERHRIEDHHHPEPLAVHEDQHPEPLAVREDHQHPEPLAVHEDHQHPEPLAAFQVIKSSGPKCVNWTQSYQASPEN